MADEYRKQIRAVLAELGAAASLAVSDLLVIGCSTSEVVGKMIGTASNALVAEVLMEEILAFADSTGVQLAIQCCEHLNRALVVEKETAREYALEPVSVIPHPDAGGALAARAAAVFQQPVVVEHLNCLGRAGIDIGNTLIGMHLRPVAVPVRTKTAQIGQAAVVCARTRPKLIGGKRARYS